jgi:hypothetical protein
MRRLTTILLCASALLFVGAAIYWFAWVRSIREFRLGDDLHHALGVLNRVQLGERRCYRARGQFAPLQDLGPGGCGGLERRVSVGMEDGFAVEVHAAADRYSVRVHPIDGTRLCSPYSDQTGAIHFGTRDRPAMAGSRLLVPRK